MKAGYDRRDITCYSYDGLRDRIKKQNRNKLNSEHNNKEASKVLWNQMGQSTNYVTREM